MLRVLTLSTLYPDRTRPGFGAFVERQTARLAAHSDIELKVAAGFAVPALGLGRFHPRYRDLIALPAREEWNGIDVLRVPFATLPMLGGRINPWSLERGLVPVLDRLRGEFAFDVIDAEFFYPDGPAAVALGRRYGVPVSIKARGSDIHLWGAIPACRAKIVNAGRAADGLLAVSAALRDDMIGLGLPGEKISVHHTGVDQGMFRPQDRAAAKAALSVEGPLVACIGNLIPIKGQALLIEAMAALPGVTLLIAGRGPEREALAARIVALGLGDRVRLLGALPHDQLPALLAAADVMALPSEREGLANAWVEALACGTPIVISDVGGARELVDRPAAGRLVERTPGAIAGGIRAVLADPRPQAEVAEATKRFTWERNTEALYAHLRGLVG
ncbi:glycosyltransferase [Rhizorhabdus dicambivorans]|uniref:Glycosyltransferase family 4 protein n=1 Tax=Rhizorhabdus dicambivorans TaxID=1850238 RepID=A0A2A4FTQ2_9SPHN|nr:glycosyltransferase [Rhizorhabdus dicambivorans]ATE66434.1 glycosyltransferase family 4 protein [Rhizorhabdus dicambivorans]PCE41074.1 glycosyltransferase family 4 protein [Rhizorhabdus dicambivorans]